MGKWMLRWKYLLSERGGVLLESLPNISGQLTQASIRTVPKMVHTKLAAVSRKDKILNALCTYASLYLFYFGPIHAVIITIIIFFTPLCPFLIIYFVWIYYDRKTPYREGRRSKWIRSLPLFRRFRDYFPQKLVKTSDLSPDENHMLCIFPHGILCTGAFSQFASDNPDFEKLFPGITVSCHTLNSNFWYPFSREYTLAIGFCAVSKEALLYQLSKPKGRAACVVIGGSAEAMISSPGTHRVILKNRKGFVKLSLITGTNLVPVYLFGETDLYSHYIFPKNSFIHKAQQAVRKFTGIAPVLVTGAGFFQSYFGFLPKPKPVHMVVGRPIKVKRNFNPTRDDVDNLHKKFIEELINLFEEHKHKYVPNPETTHLSIEE